MNLLASECSSGCESGWTLYLEQSFLKPNVSASHSDTGFCEEHKEKRGKYEEEEEEDLSMVSDASSGPPHFHDDYDYFNDQNGCSCSASKISTLEKRGKKKQKVKENQSNEDQHLPSFLDDTASSPVFNFSMTNFSIDQQASMESVLDFSQGFSATYFEGRSAFHDHFGFLQPSISENNFQKNHCSCRSCSRKTKEKDRKVQGNEFDLKRDFVYFLYS
ncbi:Angiogenin-2 like [Quillaja saponaria]|uniref:Angiogenin-2 like n=1 Tax=Quillaja saponaria TaxID=32244 RepID=A0AAD7KUN0_QUISA|nr:Angiogenin-2 like [Quillaja saponaria]